jgi:hypothetical protein
MIRVGPGVWIRKDLADEPFVVDRAEAAIGWQTFGRQRSAPKACGARL